MYQHIFPNIDMYQHIFPNIDMYQHVFPNIDMYQHILPNIDMYQHILVKVLNMTFRGSPSSGSRAVRCGLKRQGSLFAIA
jgi:hypothetical protein